MSFTPDTKPKKHSNKNTLVALGIALLMLLSFVGGYFMQRLTRPPQVQTIVEVVELIDKVGYVYDPTTGDYVELDGEKVAESIANNFLDQYSDYYTKEEYEKIMEEAKGNYKGFGISYDTTNDCVFKVVGNSPAEKAGLKAGDVIIAGKKAGDVDFTDLSGGQSVSDFFTSCDALNEYTFKLSDNSEITMQKAEYTATYVKYYDSEKSASFTYDSKTLQLVEHDGETLTELSGKADVFVVKLDSFEGGAFEQIKKAFDYAKGRGRSKLVLDLRGNGGGQMDILIKICSLLVDGDEPLRIAYAAEANNRTELFLVDTNRYRDFITNISIVADENTASASECLIGAMLYHHGEKYNNQPTEPEKESNKKDWDEYYKYNNEECSVFGYGRLVLVENGEGVAKTYGKGIMQTTYRLESGGALKLTTAKLYWPDYYKKKEAATYIHGTGITTAMGAIAAPAADALARAITALDENAIVNPAVRPIS